MCTRVIQSVFVSCLCIFSYIVLIFHIFRLTQDKITMPQPPHTHRNHPSIIPHPKTVFLSDLSVCITDSSEGTPVALHNRFNELSTISEIPEIPNSPPPPSNAPPPHTYHHRHPRLHTHIHMSQNHVRLPYFLIHRSISQSLHMFTITHTLHYLIRKQMPSPK